MPYPKSYGAVYSFNAMMNFMFVGNYNLYRSKALQAVKIWSTDLAYPKLHTAYVENCTIPETYYMFPFMLIERTLLDNEESFTNRLYLLIQIQCKVEICYTKQLRIE